MSLPLEKRSKIIEGSKILILGISYKKNIDDYRESPSLEITKSLLKMGANISYNDPFFPFLQFQSDKEESLRCIDLTIKNIKSQDCVILLTDHDLYEYDMIEKYSKLLIDTRGRFNRSEKIIRA